MNTDSLTEHALALLKKTHKLREVVLVHFAQTADPNTVGTVHEFVAVSARDPNGPSYRVILSADGSLREQSLVLIC